MQLTCGNHYENIFVKINDFNIGLRPSNIHFNALLNGFIPGICDMFEFSFVSRPWVTNPLLRKSFSSQSERVIAHVNKTVDSTVLSELSEKCCIFNFGCDRTFS